jgi:hypothetical protein
MEDVSIQKSNGNLHIMCQNREFIISGEDITSLIAGTRTSCAATDTSGTSVLLLTWNPGLKSFHGNPLIRGVPEFDIPLDASGLDPKILDQRISRLQTLYGADHTPEDLEKIAYDRRRMLEPLYGFGKRLRELERIAKHHQELEQHYGPGNYRDLLKIQADHHLLKETYGFCEDYKALKQLEADRRQILEPVYRTGLTIPDLEQIHKCTSLNSDPFWLERTDKKIVISPDSFADYRKKYLDFSSFEELKELTETRKKIHKRMRMRPEKSGILESLDFNYTWYLLAQLFFRLDDHQKIVEEYAVLKNRYGEQSSPELLLNIAASRKKTLGAEYGWDKSLDALETIAARHQDSATRHQELERILGRTGTPEELHAIREDYERLKNLYRLEKTYDELLQIVSDRRKLLEPEYGYGLPIEVLESRAIAHKKMKELYGEGSLEELKERELEYMTSVNADRSAKNYHANLKEDQNYYHDLYQ